MGIQPYAGMDALAVLLKGVLPVLAVELVLVARSAGCAWLASRVWQRYHERDAVAL